MNFYDNDITTKYIDENIPEEKHINKKKMIGMMILFFIILILLIIGVFFFVFKNEKDNQSELKNIIVINNTYEPSFSKDIYDYYLITKDKELEIKCDTNDEYKGCNETINLNNYSNYIHEITLDNQIYKIYIKVKESDSEENIVINSIDKNNNWTNTNQVVKVNATSKNEIDMYSFDNGISWQKSNSYTVDENTVLNIIVKDKKGHLSAVREEEIDSIDHINPTGIIVKEKSNEKKITLKVVAKDEESGIDGYSWNGKEYNDKDTYEISNSGTYKVKIKDKAGNIEEISIDIKESDFNNKTQYTVTLYKNGSTNIGNDFLSCTKKDGKCVVTIPTIEKAQSEIIGWSTNKDSKELEYKVNEKITLDKSLTLYAITKQDLTATFDKNGAKSISKDKEKCTLYNSDKYCYVSAPEIIYEKGKVIGWNTNKDTLTVYKTPSNKIKLREDTTYYALMYKEIIVKFNSNGSDSISSTKEICRQQEGTNSCVIQTPNITRKSSNIIGWSTNKNDKNYDVLANQELEVTEDSTYYAITEKNITITFDSNGADSITNNKVNCSFYNNANSCQVKTPSIARKNATIIGWSTNKNATSKELNENETITVRENKTYYAITKKDVEAVFISNGADSIVSDTKKCTYYNSSQSCQIKTPDINRDYWTVIGWSTNKNATSTNIQEQSNINIKDDTKYYAITSKTLTAIYHLNTADSLGNCSNPKQNGCIETCTMYNLKNSCEVSIPYIYSTGNEVQFFSTGTNPQTTTGYSPAKKLVILDNVNLYAIVDNRYRKYTYDIVKTKKYNYTAVETETGCSSKVYNKYYSFMDTAYQKAPYLFTAAKVTFSTENSFHETWGVYAGMTYGTAIGYRNIDIKCTTTFSDYYIFTIIHELVHGWDSYYYAQTGEYISGNTDIINLYNKYRKSSTRPLRGYAYSNIGEFISDAYAWYYFIYIDPQNQPTEIKQNLYYPNDLKVAIEKYIKISKSGYK